MSAVSVKLFRMVLTGAETQGVTPAQLLAAVGMTAEDVSDPDARLPIAYHLRLWHEAIRLTGDESFGLHLAERMQIGDFGGLGYVVRSSATLDEGYQRLSRYLRLMNGEVSLGIERDGQLARLYIAPPPSELRPPRQLVEFFLALLLSAGRIGVGDAFVLREVRFRHPQPEKLDELRRIFGTALRFDQPRSELCIDREALSLPQVQAEPGLCEVLDRHLQEMLDKLPTQTSLLERVRTCSLLELQQGEPTLERVAQRLRLSPRSLQRRLQQEGISLQEVLTALRKDLAMRYLSEASESISEIAFLLGFAEVSTFHRAFKRWTGLTPAAYRRTSSAASAPRGSRKNGRAQRG